QRAAERCERLPTKVGKRKITIRTTSSGALRAAFNESWKKKDNHSNNEQRSVASGFQRSWKKKDNHSNNEQRSVASGFQRSWKEKNHSHNEQRSVASGFQRKLEKEKPFARDTRKERSAEFPQATRKAWSESARTERDSASLEWRDRVRKRKTSLPRIDPRGCGRNRLRQNEGVPTLRIFLANHRRNR
ncbi:hypothetical protein, partial [Leptospira yasudae]|uniref:hypothetical protein n=1 Tax=Leptospira yasudae TaxID=2202201 RepID=UPI001C4F446C